MAHCCSFLAVTGVVSRLVPLIGVRSDLRESVSDTFLVLTVSAGSGRNRFASLINVGVAAGLGGY